MKKYIFFLSSVVILSSCAKDIPDNNGEFHGTAFRLNRPNYNEAHNYNQGEVGTHPICNGSFDWGRNFGNSWSFNEFDNTNQSHYAKLYTDSIGYISFKDGGIGELVLTNQDSIDINVQFYYEIVAKDKNNHYININWDDVKIKTYHRGNAPLGSFNYKKVGEDLYVFEASMTDYDGIFQWGGNYISWFNNDFTKCYTK